MISKAVIITFVSADPTLELVLELDTEKNESVTRFDYNTKAYFRAYTYPENMTLKTTPTDGVLSNEGSGNSDEEEIVTFIDSNESKLAKPCKSIQSTTWLGTSLGAISIKGSKIIASKVGTAVLKVVYTSHFRRYGLYLSTRDQETYLVIVYVIGS